MARKILIFGAHGQVGRALMNLLGEHAIGISRDKADFSKPDTLPALVHEAEPRVVINAAAYTAVDQAEKDPQTARIVNARAPEVLARTCLNFKIPFIHYSTDYVFSGKPGRPWVEDDVPFPLNVYGKSKLEGEEKIAAVGGRFLILRTSWVYDAQGKNFLNTILRLAAERDTLKVVSDQMGAPTYAPHLALATLEALQKTKGYSEFPSGTYHLCNSGKTSWHGFAEAIVRAAQAKELPLKVQRIDPIPTSEYPTPAKRPLNSMLNMEKIEKTFEITMPDWTEGLAACMKEKE